LLTQVRLQCRRNRRDRRDGDDDDECKKEEHGRRDEDEHGRKKDDDPRHERPGHGEASGEPHYEGDERRCVERDQEKLDSALNVFPKHHVVARFFDCDILDCDAHHQVRLPR
jgi:hypothetical protein